MSSCGGGRRIMGRVTLDWNSKWRRAITEQRSAAFPSNLRYNTCHVTMETSLPIGHCCSATA